MSFQAEQHLARIRPSRAALFLPFVALFLASALVGFYAGRLQEQWQNILVWSLSGLIALVFWVVPLIKFLTHWSDVTTSRITTRSGLFGQHHREVSLSKVSGAQAGPKRTVILTVQSEEPFVLSKVPRPKALSGQINSLIASK